MCREHCAGLCGPSHPRSGLALPGQHREEEEVGAGARLVTGGPPGGQQRHLQPPGRAGAAGHGDSLGRFHPRDCK